MVVVDHGENVGCGVEVENASGNEYGRGGLRVRVLGLSRQVGRRPCVRMRGVQKQSLHIRELLFLCFDQIFQRGERQS